MNVEPEVNVPGVGAEAERSGLAAKPNHTVTGRIEI
jgi:hypothetical protein